jgi:SAM-dependent methyltransferase
VTTWAMPVGSGDRWADDYERGRPGWPASAISVAGVAPDATVLDLGAGTGKLTRLLVGRFARVIAIEPADAMRRVLEAVCPAAESYAGTADAIPLPDASVDAVYAAQAFHWFDDDRSAREIRRVLRPGGALVAMFNAPGVPVEPPIDDVLALLRERSPDVVDYDPLDLGHGRAPSLSGFGSFEHARFPNPQTFDREELVAFYASMGWIGDLPDPERLPLLDSVRARLTAGEYRRVWETDVYWAART